MADDMPTASATLPRNFQYHEFALLGQLPKTPERSLCSEVENAEQEPPRPPRYHLRRSGRLSKASLNRSSGLSLNTAADIPIPTIEMPDDTDSVPMTGVQHDSVEESRSFSADHLNPPMDPRLPPPRTPSPQLSSPIVTTTPWVQTAREGVPRSSSAASMMSDSSEDSDVDSDDGFSYGGSCTSPESDIGSMDGFRSKQGLPSVQLTFEPDSSPTLTKKGKDVRFWWTPDMDNHLWQCYMKYLNDPTKTPFKSWPGTAPPLGVCRRVAREAKKTWKGQKATTANAASGKDSGLVRKGSAETITAARSGSNTPIDSQKSQPWPKSGKSTRRRFRELCKKKASIAPHYQRMLKSRSPEPALGSVTGGSRRPRFSSPDMFSAREVRLSLATSTAMTMQPHGPMAQLSRDPNQNNRRSSLSSWFNDPSVAWASPPPVPSSDFQPTNNVSTQEVSSPPALPPPRMNRLTPDPPRLGSPFSYHTWTAGHRRTRRSMRSASNAQESSTLPRLRSPFDAHGTFPYSINHKRRAQGQLEEELSPGGSAQNLPSESDVFGGPLRPAQRRVRARGFSYGDALTQGRLSNSQPTHSDSGPQTIHRFTTPSNDISAGPAPVPTDVPRRLGSPFAGINSRPNRSRRQMAGPSSLASWDSPAFPSIEQTLEETANHDRPSFQ